VSFIIWHHRSAQFRIRALVSFQAQLQRRPGRQVAEHDDLEFVDSTSCSDNPQSTIGGLVIYWVTSEAFFARSVFITVLVAKGFQTSQFVATGFQKVAFPERFQSKQQGSDKMDK
jgi:hypothetical protein